MSMSHGLRTPPRTLRAFIALSLGVLSSGCGELRESRVIPGDTLDSQLVEIEFEVDSGTVSNLPPDFGLPCDENNDCETGLCIEGVNTSVCSKTCISECPDGWSCRGVTLGGVDVIFVCVEDGTPDSDTQGGDTNTADTAPPSDTVSDTGGPSDTNTQEDTSTDTGPLPDTVEPTGPTGTACDAPPGATNDRLQGEPQVLGGDFPDCIVGCEVEVNPTLWVIDLANSNFTGASGRLDGDDHYYTFDSGDKAGPDTDVIAIRAPPRTMLEVAVLKSSLADATEPVVYIHDGFQVRTYNSDVSSTNTCARTTMGFPWVSSLPVYVVIEDAANYERWTPTGFSPGLVGGDDYGWHLRIRTSAFSPFDLGTFSRLQVIDIRGESLTIGGMTRYYRFYAPGTTKPRVRLTRTSSSAFEPTLAGMKTIAGELAWQGVNYDNDSDGVVLLPPNAFRPCIPQSECPSGFSCPPNLCSEADAEFVFAVLDYNGDGAASGFTYDLQIVIE
jgi:hypothetical protein